MEVLANATFSGAVPLAGVIVKLATGAGALTVTEAVLVVLPPGPVAVSLTA